MEQLGLLILFLIGVIMWKILTRPSPNRVERETAKFTHRTPRPPVTEPEREHFLLDVVSMQEQLFAEYGEKLSPEQMKQILEAADRAYCENPTSSKEWLARERARRAANRAKAERGKRSSGRNRDSRELEIRSGKLQ